LILGKERLSIEFFAYIMLEATSLWFSGKLSDIWSRRKVLLLIHSSTLVTLILSYFFRNDLKRPFLLLLASGILFNPGPAARAILIDNFKSTIIKTSNNFYSKLHLTETRLIGISWIVQYLPWIFGPFFILLSEYQRLFLIIGLLLFSIPLLYYQLSDSLENSVLSKHRSFIKNFNKAPLILSGLLFAQLVFFTTFDKVDFLKNSSNLFSLIGIGALLGTIFSLFFRKTPHLSVVTYSYAFGMMLSFTNFLYYYFPTNEFLDTGLSLIHLAAVGGFYLPFVFDIIISKSNAQHRGTLFACAEVVQSLAAVLGVIAMTLIGDNPIFLFATTTILFIIALSITAKHGTIS
jgi:MFS family permease